MNPIDEPEIGLPASPEVGNKVGIVDGGAPKGGSGHPAALQESVNLGKEGVGTAHKEAKYRIIPILQEETSYFPPNRKLPTSSLMDAVRQLILDRVPNLSETSRKIGKNHAYLQQFVHRGVPAKLPEDVRERLAPVMGVKPEDLRHVNHHSPSVKTPSDTPSGSVVNVLKPPQRENPARVPGEMLVGDRDLPVFSTAEGGRGALILSNDAVDWVARPDPLLRVKDGYGMIVTGDSMSPEHKAGSMALVNPHVPWRSGDTCVFRSVADDGTELAVIKELRRWTDTKWYVRQHHPRRDFTLKRAEWQVCHVTVGNYKRR